MTVVASDLEGTLTTGQSWKGFSSYLRQSGRRFPLFFFMAATIPFIILVQTPLLDKHIFIKWWMARLIRFLTKTSPAEIEKMAEYIVDEVMWPARREDILAELETHRQDGARIIIASGAYQPIVEAFARRIHAEGLGTEIEIVEGQARTTMPFNTGDLKTERTRARLNGDSLSHAYGDTEPDIPFLASAEQGVAVYPDATLRAAALERGWRIID